MMQFIILVYDVSEELFDPYTVIYLKHPENRSRKSIRNNGNYSSNDKLSYTRRTQL